MQSKDPCTDEAESEIGDLKARGEANGWTQADRDALFEAFEKWLEHPRLLDPEDTGSLRITVINELTWLIPKPVIGEHAWECIRRLAKRLGPEDPHQLRESLRIATFELAAEPPLCVDFLEKLFTLAEDEDTRWAVLAAYENFPWRLRPHARQYSKGLISDQDCDEWLIEQGLGDDEVLMRGSRSVQDLTPDA